MKKIFLNMEFLSQGHNSNINMVFKSASKVCVHLEVLCKYIKKIILHLN